MNWYVIRDKHGRYLMREAREGGQFAAGPVEDAARFPHRDADGWIARLSTDLPDFGLYAEAILP